MIAFLGVVSLFLTPVFLVIMVIQAIRKQKVKKWAIALGVCLLCFVFCLVIDGGNIEPAAPKMIESEEKQEETKEPVIESEEESEIVEEVSEEVKNFAEENGISIELAQSVEKVLLETDIPDSLNILNGWEQTEDYAYGQRYIAQSYSLAQDKYFYVMFYVQDDEVVSVRDRKNNLEVLWSKYCVKMDIRKFYPSIPHDRLKARLREKIKDEKALGIIDKVIDSHSPGIPIGNYTSPWLAEFFLQPLDWFIKQTLGVRHYIRYADDLVLIDSNKRKLRKALYAVMEFVEGMGMTLKPNYQLFRIQQFGRGRKIDFVGRCFGRGFTTIRKRRALALMRQSRHIQKLQRANRPVPYKIAAGFLSRSACFKHTNSYGMKRKYYDSVNIKKLKEVVSNESKRKRLSGGAGLGVLQTYAGLCGTQTA